MSLIQRVGGHGLAELIISQILTNASCPNCYFPDKKVYGFVAAEEDQIYFFDEDSNQYLNCLDASESLGEHVLLVDLKAELFGVGCEGGAKISLVSSIRQKRARHS